MRLYCGCVPAAAAGHVMCVTVGALVACICDMRVRMVGPRVIVTNWEDRRVAGSECVFVCCSSAHGGRDFVEVAASQIARDCSLSLCVVVHWDGVLAARNWHA